MMSLNKSQDFMEEWTRWEPIEKIFGRYYIDALILSEKNDLIIKLSNENDTHKIKIKFPNPVGSYKYTNESFCFKIFGDLSDKYGVRFYSNWSFFKITNSQYLQWLSEQSGTISNVCLLQHFCMVGGDEVIDVATQFEPEVTIIA